MSAVSSDQLTTLMVARRLMITAREVEAERQGKQIHRTTAKEAMEEDQALISGEAKGAQKSGEPAPQLTQSTGLEINLLDLSSKLHSSQSQTETAQTQMTSIEFRQKEEIEIQVRYTELPRVEGLVVRNQNQAETDRYAFDFQAGQSFKITDKWTGKYTRIWGDPHVDTSDQEGDRNGEFSDLKGSNSQTTLMLLDGTRVTFSAKDNGLIENVDLYQGSQHLGGTGAGLKDYKAETGMFAKTTDSQPASSVPLGDTVYAGGDGADWYDASGNLVWGKTTGPGAASRPGAVVQMTYRYSLSQQISFQSIGTTA